MFDMSLLSKPQQTLVCWIVTLWFNIPQKLLCFVLFKPVRRQRETERERWRKKERERERERWRKRERERERD